MNEPTVVGLFLCTSRVVLEVSGRRDWYYGNVVMV